MRTRARTHRDAELTFFLGWSACVTSAPGTGRSEQRLLLCVSYVVRPEADLVT